MSGEHIINNEINTSTRSEKNKNSKRKVDINILLNKIRQDEKKEKQSYFSKINHNRSKKLGERKTISYNTESFIFEITSNEKR